LLGSTKIHKEKGTLIKELREINSMDMKLIEYILQLIYLKSNLNFGLFIGQKS